MAQVGRARSRAVAAAVAELPNAYGVRVAIAAGSTASAGKASAAAIDRLAAASIHGAPHAAGGGIAGVTPSEAAILFAVSTVAGAVNAVAGGGSLLTFPVLVWLGRDPILANATNTVSLSPGSVAALHGFRRELGGLERWIVRGTLPSLVGGVLGAMLLLRTPSPIFAWLVPYLILFATALFALAGPVNALARRRAAEAEHLAGTPAAPRWAAMMLYQLAVSIYGGYFGAGIGIMMLAGLALGGFTAIHRAIALRNYYAILINGVAAVYFALWGPVDWTDALVLTAGQILGGITGARIARRLPATTVRWVVVAIGVAMALSLFGGGG